MNAIARLTWKVGGFELRFLTGASLLAAVGALVLVLLLQVNRPHAACLEGGLVAARCDTALFYQLGSLGSQLIVATGLLPLAVGAVLGSASLGREIERGTAQLPWSLAPSRQRWLAERLGLLLVVSVAILVIPAIASMLLEGAIDPAANPTATLVDFGFRGVSILTRAIAILALGAFIGLAFGRLLPALLVSIAIGGAMILVLPPISLALQPTEVIAQLGDPQVRYGSVRDERYENASGELLTIDEATAMVPDGTEDPTSWIDSHFRHVAIGVRGERYWRVEATSAAILAGVTLFALAGAFAAVARRRPYQ